MQERADLTQASINTYGSPGLICFSRGRGGAKLDILYGYLSTLSRLFNILESDRKELFITRAECLGSWVI